MKAKDRKQPLKLVTWGRDWYSLGIFCGMMNIVGYAKENVSVLCEDKEAMKLFNAGVVASRDSSIDDIAFNAGRVRDHSDADKFDEFIAENAGQYTMIKLREAISKAHDWETAEQKANAKKIMWSMCNKTGKAENRTSVFGEYYAFCG